MVDARPLLSIVIPSYNSAEWLPTTIGSVTSALDQSQLIAEIVLVDDGSTDEKELIWNITSIWPTFLDPSFRASYRPRTTVRKLLEHGFLRGTLFVDSYYGASLVRIVALWLIALSVPIGVLSLGFAGLTRSWLFAIVLIGVCLADIRALEAAAIVNRAPRRPTVSFLVCVVAFALEFWAGIGRRMFLWFRGKTA